MQWTLRNIGAIGLLGACVSLVPVFMRWCLSGELPWPPSADAPIFVIGIGVFILACLLAAMLGRRRIAILTRQCAPAAAEQYERFRFEHSQAELPEKKVDRRQACKTHPERASAAEAASMAIRSSRFRGSVPRWVDKTMENENDSRG